MRYQFNVFSFPFEQTYFCTSSIERVGLACTRNPYHLRAGRLMAYLSLLLLLSLQNQACKKHSKSKDVPGNYD